MLLAGCDEFWEGGQKTLNAGFGHFDELPRNDDYKKIVRIDFIVSYLGSQQKTSQNITKTYLSQPEQ